MAAARRQVRNQPDYPLEVVDELPEETRAGGRSKLYYNLLDQIRQNPNTRGRWVLVAEFRTHDGARDAVTAIRNGERAIPPGEWDFEWRRFTDEKSGVRESNLYAKYHGELESAG